MSLEDIAWIAGGIGAVYFTADINRADTIHRQTNLMLSGAIYRLTNDQIPDIEEKSLFFFGPASYKARKRYEHTLAAIAKLKETPRGQEIQELFDIK